MSTQARDKPEKLGPDSGRVVGVLGLVIGLVTLVLVLRDGLNSGNLTGAACILLVMVLIWALLLRPAIFLGESTLRLRNMFVDVTVPLASVDDMTVRQVVVIHTDDGSGFHSTALTRHRRELRDQDRGKQQHDPLSNFADFAEERIRSRAEEARARGEESGPVQRVPAWPEIGAVVVLAVAAVMTALV